MQPYARLSLQPNVVLHGPGRLSVSAPSRVGCGPWSPRSGLWQTETLRDDDLAHLLMLRLWWGFRTTATTSTTTWAIPDDWLRPQHCGWMVLWHTPVLSGMMEGHTSRQIRAGRRRDRLPVLTQAACLPSRLVVPVHLLVLLLLLLSWLWMWWRYYCWGYWGRLRALADEDRDA